MVFGHGITIGDAALTSPTPQGRKVDTTHTEFTPRLVSLFFRGPPTLVLRSESTPATPSGFFFSPFWFLIRPQEVSSGHGRIVEDVVRSLQYLRDHKWVPSTERLSPMRLHRSSGDLLPLSYGPKVRLQLRWVLFFAAPVSDRRRWPLGTEGSSGTRSWLQQTPQGPKVTLTH